MEEFLGLKFVTTEKFPDDLREKGRRIVVRDEAGHSGTVIEAFQMPNTGTLYITRVFDYTSSEPASGSPK